MPVALSRGDRNLLLSGAAVFVLLIGVAVLLSGGAGDTTETPTTYSAGLTGAKAAYLLLPSLGYRVERWTLGPEALDDAATTTLILAEPYHPPTEDERASIQRFLDRGGRVIATGYIGSLFFGNAATPNPIDGLTWTRVRAAAPSSITRAAPEIALAPRTAWNGARFAIALYRVDDADVVVQMPAGAGEAFWWASATPLTNAGLREPGNLEFLLASLGPPAGRRVVFDEYFHGVRTSLIASVLATPVKWILIQLALVGALVLFTYSRRSGPVVPQPAETRLSPVEFVRTLGSLYERARVATVAVDAAYRRFRFQLTRRLGTSPDATPDALERAVRDRFGAVDPAFAATIRACEAARDNPSLTPRAALALVQALAGLAASLQLFPRSDKETT